MSKESRDTVPEILVSYGWDDNKIKNFRRDLLSWYDQNKRDLPWRRSKNPYHIWISEIMLQQTQVVTVIPYFERFIKALPTIEALANVDEQELLVLWQGLGYYSRARNLKIAANQIMENHYGEMPNTMKELLALKGIGPYTAAAIGSIAFGLVEPAIDGNLLRVTARLFELDADIAKASSRKVFSDILYELIDPERPGDFNQAMMDLGATIMTPGNLKPEESPVKGYDASYLNETAALYPVKTKKVKQTYHHMLAYLVRDSYGNVLYRQHQLNELLTGLWHYPIIEHEIDLSEASEEEIVEPIKLFLQTYELNEPIQLLNLNQNTKRQFPKVKHVFSHRLWHLNLILCQYQGVFDVEKFVELTINQDEKEYPISTLQQKLQRILEDVI